jgi:uncharacterized protein YndB with AHSA1/START domain
VETAWNLEKLAGPLEQCIWIRGDEAAVAQAWTSAEEIQKWFLTRAENRDALGEVMDEAKEGGSFRWEWIEQTEDRGTYHLVTDRAIEFGWYGDTGVVRVDWEQDGGEVRVRLRQEMFEGSVEEKAKIQHGCAVGWAFFLSNLKCWIENGIDLRETNLAHKKAINV